jgi:hypothetical protein
MYRTMGETIHGTCAYNQPTFSVYRTQLTGKPSPQFERAENTGLKQHEDFTFNLYLLMIFAFKGNGSNTSRYANLRAVHTSEPQSAIYNYLTHWWSPTFPMSSETTVIASLEVVLYFSSAPNLLTHFASSSFLSRVLNSKHNKIQQYGDTIST